MPAFDNHPIDTRMKKTSSMLRDLPILAKLEEERKHVHTETDRFDTVLVTMFFRSLENDGMLCIEDESDYNQRGPAPSSLVFLTVAGVRYLCRVVLRPKGETAVHLSPQPRKN